MTTEYSAIQAQIDELQKQLDLQQIAKKEQERKTAITNGSIEQLEEFCNISDTILDRPPPCAAGRAAMVRARAWELDGWGDLPPSPGDTCREVFKNRLNPKHPLHHRQFYLHEMGIGMQMKMDFHPSFKDTAFKASVRNCTEREIKMVEWENQLEEKVYSTTCASDMYINDSLKCILTIVKKQQKEINFLKEQLLTQKKKN
tara:strand:+ start:865 stop:1467 length:603 start_codon:yes stop_codon:yes gene_type:complete